MRVMHSAAEEVLDLFPTSEPSSAHVYSIFFIRSSVTSNTFFFPMISCFPLLRAKKGSDAGPNAGPVKRQRWTAAQRLTREVRGMLSRRRPKHRHCLGGLLSVGCWTWMVGPLISIIMNIIIDKNMKRAKRGIIFKFRDFANICEANSWAVDLWAA